MENNKHKTKNYMIVMAIAAVIFVILTILVVTENAGLISLDKAIAKGFYSIRNDGLTAFAQVVTFMATWQFVSGVCLLLLIIPKTRIKVGIPVAITCALSTIIRILIKLMVMRPRPDETYWLSYETDSSFPSGHSCASMALYGLLFLFAVMMIKKQPWKIIAMIITGFLAIGVGLSRIYLGMHYPSDVLGGWMLAIVIMMIVLPCFWHFEAKIRTKKLGAGEPK